MKRRSLFALLIAASLVAPLAGAAEPMVIRMSTTTSTDN
ncbi:MAG: hypothetical protein JWP59_64, partial [Massilia sp.]|nr:hypothetical protein [Massilia sp.]